MSFVVQDKQRIFYRIEGEQGSYVLLLHGWFGSSEDWYTHGYVDVLAPEFRLILPDLRGHGRSERPQDAQHYALDAWTEDIKAILDEIGVFNVHLIGYALGALVGMHFFRRHPAQLRLLFLGGESPFVTAETLSQWRTWESDLASRGWAEFCTELCARGQIVSGGSPARTHEDQDVAHAAALALLRGLANEAVNAPETPLSIASPITCFAGAADPALRRVLEARQRIQRARMACFNGYGHSSLFVNRDLLLTEVVHLLKSGRRHGSAP